LGLPSVSFLMESLILMSTFLIFTPIYNYIKHQNYCNFNFQFLSRVWCSNFLFSPGRQPFDQILIKQQDRFGKRIVLFLYCILKFVLLSSFCVRDTIWNPFVVNRSLHHLMNLKLNFRNFM
jgi:hypothetical protein